MRRLTSADRQALRPTPAVHRRSVSFWIRDASRSYFLGRFRARFAVATSTNVAGLLVSLGCRRGAHLCMGERLVPVDVASPLKGL